MGPTEWTVISTGLVIIIANAAAFRSLRADMNSLRTDMNSLRTELWSELKDLRREIGELRERMAHLEGLLEGLRESIDRAGRNVA